MYRTKKGWTFVAFVAGMAFAAIFPFAGAAQWPGNDETPPSLTMAPVADGEGVAIISPETNGMPAPKTLRCRKSAERRPSNSEAYGKCPA